MRNITKFKRSIKGISPVISVLLMIAIAVVASLVAYAWVMGYMNFQTDKVGEAIQIPSYAEGVTADNLQMRIYVQNTGQGSVTVGNVYINDAQVQILSPADLKIDAGETKELTVQLNAPWHAGDQVKIKVTTTGGTFMEVQGTGSSNSNQPGLTFAVLTCDLSSSTITFGEGVTASGSLTASSVGIPDKTVTITYQSSGHTDVVHTQTTDSSGQYSDSYTPDVTGAWTVSVNFASDGTYASASTSRNLSVQEPDLENANVPAPTLSATTITMGNSITASVTVSGSAGTPTGSVTFQYSTDSGANWNTFGDANRPLSSGTASSASVQPNAEGSYLIRAVYSGDSVYNTATGNTETLTVNKATATVSTPTVTPNPVVVNNEVQVSVTVTGVSGVSDPTSTVQFQVKIGSGSWNDFNSAVSLSSGSASTTYTPTTVDTYQFQAIYSGDNNYYDATSQATSLTVNPNTGTFGNTQAGSSSYSTSIENSIVGSVFTSPAYTVKVDSISAYVHVTTDYNVKAAIYTTGGSLVASTQQVAVSTSTDDQFVVFNFASADKPTLSASTQYVIVVWTNNQGGYGGSQYAYLYGSSNTGGLGRTESSSYTGTFPSNVGSWEGSNTIKYSIYCSYTIP